MSLFGKLSETDSAQNFKPKFVKTPILFANFERASVQRMGKQMIRKQRRFWRSIS
jgi:hypothetical protein